MLYFFTQKLKKIHFEYDKISENLDPLKISIKAYRKSHFFNIKI